MLNIDVSIIIPSYNRDKDLNDCLLSIHSQENVTYEVIIVDDGSTDNTCNMVNEHFPKVTLLRNDNNYGPSFARNIGINAARGKYILFLDSDTVFSSELTLEKFIKFFNEHKDAGTVGGEIRAYQNEYNIVYGKVIKFDGNSEDLIINNIKNTFKKCDFLATCCCMVRKDHATNIGGFDPYYGFGGEDKDFGYRIKELGLQNYLSADCAVTHNHSKKGRDLNETYRYHYTRLRFCIKFYSIYRIIFIIIIIIIKSIIYYLVLPMKILFYMIINKKLYKENYFGGWFMIKSVIRNLINFIFTKQCKENNFLSKSQIVYFINKTKK